MLLIESYRNRINRELLQKADMDYRLSVSISFRIASMFSKDNKPLSFEDLYKDIIDSNKTEEEKRKEEEEKAKAEDMRQQMLWMQYISNVNKQFENKE